MTLFLNVFERTASVARWPEDQWAPVLIPCLIGPVQQTFAGRGTLLIIESVGRTRVRRGARQPSCEFNPLPLMLTRRVKTYGQASRCFTGGQPGYFQCDYPHMDCSLIKTLRGTQVGHNRGSEQFMVGVKLEGKCT